MRKGLLIIYTGNGKGKTTATLGLTLRAAGHGMRILILQFIKGAWHYGELDALKRFPEVTVQTLGSGFTWKKESPAEDMELAQRGWARAAEAIRRAEHDIIVLDELNYVLSYKLIPLEPVLEAIRTRREDLHVVITGRNAPKALIEMADLVTDMRQIKHPYHDKGIKAQQGIEF